MTGRPWAITIVALVLAAGFAGARRNDLAAATDVLATAAPLPFLVAVGLSVIGVVNRAGQYRAAHRLAGVEATIRSMARVSAAGYALNKVVKTGGAGGVALFVRHGRRRGQPAGSVLTACVVNSLGNQIGMLVVTTIALAALIARDSTPATWTLAAGTAILLLVAGLFTVGLVGPRSRALAERWHPLSFALIGRAAARFGMTGPPAPNPEHLDRFFAMIETIRRDPMASIPVLVHAVAAKLIGGAVLATALIAVGAEIGPGPVLVVYVLALAAAATTILPGGLGAVEATMTLALAGYGVPPALALAGTIVFRLLDLWVPVLLGLLAAPGLDRVAVDGAPQPDTTSAPMPVQTGTVTLATVDTFPEASRTVTS